MIVELWQRCLIKTADERLTLTLNRDDAMQLRSVNDFIIILLFFLAHQHKAAGMNIELSKNNDHEVVLHRVIYSQQSDHIRPSKSNRSSIIIAIIIIIILNHLFGKPGKFNVEITLWKLT